MSEAVELYRRAVANRPAMAEALNNLGNALRMTGDIDGAMQAYQEALTHREIYPEAYNNLGTLLQQDKKLDEAEHALRKAIGQNPRYVEAHNNLALLYSAQKKEVDALRILGDALKFAPENRPDAADHRPDPEPPRNNHPGGRAGDAGRAQARPEQRRGADLCSAKSCTRPTATTKRSRC